MKTMATTSVESRICVAARTPCDGVKMVEVDLPANANEEAERVTMREWADAPSGIHPCAQIHYANGEGYPGPVRVKNAEGVWTYVEQEIVRDAAGRPTKAVVELDGLKYDVAQLVILAFYGLGYVRNMTRRLTQKRAKKPSK
jgi:hypothetical protein